MPHDSSALASLPRPWLPGTGLALAFEQPSIVTRPFRVPIMSSRRFAGGHIACTSDATILARYGISHCLGDNLGPGAICRGLRSIPVLLDLCHDLEKWAPRAVILNYVAPIAANGIALSGETGPLALGLDCSVQNTVRSLARLAHVSTSDLDYLCAGISHQAWFLKLRRGTTDLYPRIHQALEQDGVIQAEPLISAMFKSLGYYVTESSEITGAQECHLADSIHGGHSDLGSLHRSLEDRRARPGGWHSLPNPLPANREVDHLSSGFKAMRTRHLPGARPMSSNPWKRATGHAWMATYRTGT